jgi:hypothetical protein
MTLKLSNYVSWSVTDVINYINTVIGTQILSAEDVVFPSAILADSIIVGFQTQIPGGSSLIGTMNVSTVSNNAEAVVIGTHIVIPSGDGRLNYTYPTLSDTYNDLDSSAVMHHTSVANGAGVPAVVTNSIRLEKVVTNGSGITSVQTSAGLTTSSGFTASAMAGYGARYATASVPLINQLLNATATSDGPIQNQGPITAPADFMQDQIITGLVPPSLPASITNFTFTGNSNGVTVLVSQGNRIYIPNGDSRLTSTYAVNSDTYIDISGAGVFTITAVANNATPPSITTNSTRFLKIISNSTNVTSVIAVAPQFFTPTELGNLTQAPHPVQGSPQNNGPIADPGDSLVDSIITGFQTAIPGSGLIGTMSTGSNGWAIAIVLGNRVALPSTTSVLTWTYGASQDTYNDLSYQGVITRTAVANNATPPSIAANSIRLEKVITNGSTITSVQTYAQNITSGGPTALAASGFSPSVPTISAPQINQLANGTSILPGQTIQNQGPIANPSDCFADFLITGLNPPSLPASLTAFTLTGNIYGESILISQGNRIVIPNGDSRLTRNFTASKDTYLDISGSGVFTWTAVANNASAPSIAANSTRFAKVVSGASTITGYSILASQYPLLVGGPLVNQCRAYLVSGSPYADGSTSGNGTLYFGPCPDLGNQISLWSKTQNKWITQSISETSLSLSGVSGSYDILVLSTGATTAEIIVQLTSSASYIVQDGRQIRASDGAMYVGSFSTVATGLTQDTEAIRYLSNLFNAVAKPLYIHNPSAGPYSGTTQVSIGTLYYQFCQIPGRNNSISLRVSSQIQTTVAGNVGYLGYSINSSSTNVGGFYQASDNGSFNGWVDTGLYLDASDFVVGANYSKLLVYTNVGSSNVSWSNISLYGQIWV